MSARPHARGGPALDTGLRSSLMLCGLLAAMLLPTAGAVAQVVTAAELKAAFIYNFVKFTEWPVMLPLSDPFVICVIGDAAVGDALERVVKGREVAGRRIEAKGALAKPTAACRVLYVSGATLDDAVRAIAGLQDSPVLTISDVGGFTKAGGMTQFFFDRGQLRFTIKADSVKRSGLKMSSRLLALGQR